MQDNSTDKQKEAKQERIFLERINQALQGKTENLEKIKEELEKKLESQRQNTRELEQERILLNSLNNMIEKKINESTKPSIENKNSIIDTLFGIYKEISLLRLSEFSKMDASLVSAYIETLESQGKIIRLAERKEMICRDCSSTNLNVLFYCAKCKSHNYIHGKLIEHYSCGNASIQEDYRDDICPKCRKAIKIIGNDYRVYDCFVCEQCHDKFQEPASAFKCNNCGAVFDQESAHWKMSPMFKLSNSR